MKNFKKFLAVLLALTLVMALGITAFAEDKPAPLADRTHTYTAYKIFAGTQTADANDATLGAVVWGDGIDSANFLAALKTSTDFGTDNPFAEIANTTDDDVAAAAAKVADAMKDWTDGDDMSMAFAKLAENYIIVDDPETEEENEDKGIVVVNGQTQLDAGYYLVVDTTASVQADDAYNIALLQLTKKSTFTIAAKNSVPEVEKKINNGLLCTKLDPEAKDYDKNHVHTKDCYDWKDSNNAALGDTVNFKIESAVPATATEYEYYFFIINDTLPKGLTYTANSIEVSFVDVDEDNMETITPATVTTDYTVKTVAVKDDKGVATGETNIQIALVDATANAGRGVIVTYDAILNENAIIGVEGNPNKVTVDFSNNPNEDWETGTIPSDGFPKDTTHKPNGKTPEDYTITYVSKINVYKVDENENPLQGAEFTLYGNTLNQVLVMKEQFTEATGDTAIYWKLNNGTYTTEAPITADTMSEPVKATAETEEGYVVAESGFAGETITVGGVTYRGYNPTTDVGKDVFTLIKNNVADYNSIATKYKCEWVSETKTASGDTLNVVGTVDANGVVSFAGLPAGSYTISETVVPDGYNPIDDITFTTTWTAPTAVTAGDEDCTWAVATGDNSGVTYNATADAFEITIVNQKGNTLPETGGIGTTIFYVLGGILLVGAAILLITKKRVSAEG